MDQAIHQLNDLFAQLGLGNTGREIDYFITKHRPIPAHKAIYESDIWNPSQAMFLREARDQDADWAELVDQLDAMMR